MNNENRKTKLSYEAPSQAERKEIEEKAFDIFNRSLSQNIGFISATPSFYGTLAEEAFEAARVFVQEAKFQLIKYEKSAETPKKQA